MKIQAFVFVFIIIIIIKPRNGLVDSIVVSSPSLAANWHQ